MSSTIADANAAMRAEEPTDEEVAVASVRQAVPAVDAVAASTVMQAEQQELLVPAASEQQMERGTQHKTSAVDGDAVERSDASGESVNADATVVAKQLHVIEVASHSESNSSDSSSSSSSSSSDSSSDSEVEDVTAQYKLIPSLPDQSHTAGMDDPDDDDDDDTEQWFDLDVDQVEVVGVVDAQPQYDDEDPFLTPHPPSPLKKSADSSRGSATKRRRQDDESDGVAQNASAGEETTSTSDPESSDTEGVRKRGPSRKQQPRSLKVTKRQRAQAATRLQTEPIVTHTSVPPEYSIFENIAGDNHEFPILKGTYIIKGGHRAFFAGTWGFTEADFAPDREGIVSKFEYSSGYIHGRTESDQRPFSGKYGGFFNLRQFSGKVLRIKEDQIEFHFLRFGDPDAEVDADDHDVKYEVFGKGKNRFGRFLVRGYFNPHNSRMMVRRRYLE